MSSTIQQGLLITLIGMGLVFLVIIFLWGLMGLMMRVTSKADDLVDEPVDAPAAAERQVPGVAHVDAHRRAAAAAVAVGLAIEDSLVRRLQHRDQVATSVLSPWQSVHRALQLEPHNKRG